MKNTLKKKARNYYYKALTTLVPGARDTIRLRRLTENAVAPSPPRTAPLPRHALIEINNTCNLNCTMCNTKLSQRPKGNMDPALFERIITQLKSVGSEHPGLHTVGETFMYPKLSALFDIARRHDYPLFVSTNAQFPDRIRKLLDEHADMVHHFRFSIDAADPDTYASIRRGGVLDKVMESLEVVKRFNEGASRPVPLEAGFVMSATNIDEVGPFIKMLEPYCDPSKIHFNLIDGISPDASYFQETFPFKNLVKQAKPCRMVFRNVYFTFDGKVSLCCRDYEAEVVIGDITQEDLADIWANAEAQSIRAMHLGRKPMQIKSCARCFISNRQISSIIDLYIHTLYDQGVAPDEIGKKTWSLLNQINSTINNREELHRVCTAHKI